MINVTAVISLCHCFAFCRELIDSRTVLELAPNYKVTKCRFFYQNDYKKDILIMASSRVGGRGGGFSNMNVLSKTVGISETRI